jgi:hypothetical protein
MVNGSEQMGINGNRINNLTMTTVTVQNAGNSDQEDGIRLFNLTGSAAGMGMTGVTISNPYGMGLHIASGLAGTLGSAVAPFTIRNSTFQNSVIAQGVVINPAAAATLHVRIVGGTNTGHFSNGIQTATSAGTFLGLTVDSVSFSNTAGATIVQASAGTTQFALRNNTIVARNSGSGHSVIIKGDGTGIATGTILGNKIGDVGGVLGASCGSCNGINVDARNSSQITVEIRGNTIRNVDNAGIQLRDGQGTAKINAIVTGNLIADPLLPNAFAGIFVDSGVLSGGTAGAASTAGGGDGSSRWRSTRAQSRAWSTLPAATTTALARW